MRAKWIQWSCGSLLGLAGLVSAQIPTPMPPTAPQTLPPSITGQPGNGTNVRPTGAAVPQQPAAAPIMRFAENLTNFPPETVQSVYGLRAGADWLFRMNQANGRFFYGLNPAIPRALDGDHDIRQGLACVALAEAARFTRDNRFTARATQSALALLAQVKQDPITATDKANRCGLQATVALALYALPEADPKLIDEGEKLVQALRSRIDKSGLLRITDDGVKPDAEMAAHVPGLVLQAIAQSHQLRPESGKEETILLAGQVYRNALKQQPNTLVAASLLPALCEIAQTKKDPGLVAMIFELADSVADLQFGRADTPPVGWFGGFKVAPNSLAEPSADSGTMLQGLAAALKLTRQVPDLNRYTRYRGAIVEGLNFCRNLQYSEENTGHFEKAYRQQMLLGGVRTSPTEGTLRIDATAQVVLAYLQFLNSGGVTRE